MNFRNGIVGTVILVVLMFGQAIAVEKERPRELSDKNVQPPWTIPKRRIRCDGNHRALVRGDPPNYIVYCYGFHRDSDVVGEKCAESSQAGSARGLVLEKVRVAGMDYCIVKNAFRHKPDCGRKFKRGSKGRIMIQEGRDWCVAGTERFLAACKGPKTVYSVAIDQQANQDFCIPRKYGIKCKLFVIQDGRVQILDIKREIDKNGSIDSCIAEYYNFSKPRLG